MSESKQPPEKIYLQFYGDEPPNGDPYVDESDVTWASTQIYKWDILYVRVKKKHRKTKEKK